MAKNTAVMACDHAVQMHGGLGHLRDAEVERHYRDARRSWASAAAPQSMNEIIATQLGV